MNKVKITITSLIFCTILISTVHAEQSEVKDEQTSADFLDFLAEIEDATGDGFETWLETESDDDK